MTKKERLTGTDAETSSEDLSVRKKKMDIETNVHLSNIVSFNYKPSTSAP